MGLYTKKVKGDEPPKEVKKKGRPPKKVAPVEEEKVEVEQPKESELEPVKQEVQKVEEIPLPEIPVEKTTPPPEIQEPEPLPLKKEAVKKKVVKKVEKKVSPKEEEPPTWFKKFISEASYEPKATKKENNDIVKQVASKMWNAGVKPRSSNVESVSHNGYEKLYNQIFGR